MSFKQAVLTLFISWVIATAVAWALYYLARVLFGGGV